jgi:hypothetical protein
VELSVTYLRPEKLVSLRTGEAWAKIGRSAFQLYTTLAPQQPDYHRAEQVFERSRKNYGYRERWEAESKRPPQNPPKQLPEKGDEEPPDPSKVF